MVRKKCNNCEVMEPPKGYWYLYGTLDHNGIDLSFYCSFECIKEHFRLMGE